MSKVGFIGLGIMGRPMAKNMVKAGVELLVTDLNQEAVAEVVAAGAQAADYSQIGAQCEVIFTIVPNGDIVSCGRYTGYYGRWGRKGFYGIETIF